MKKSLASGTQSLVRTIEVLKAVASRKEIGWRLTDLARHCGMPKSTVHRIVACLQVQGMVEQRPGDRRYVPGSLLFELALSLPAHFAFREALHGELEKIVRSGTIAFLYLKSGAEVVCIDQVGELKVPPLITIGTRRKIIESTFGIAMLLAMPKKEQEAHAFITESGPRSRRSADYRRVLRRSLEHGFGFNGNDVSPGVSAVAVPLLDRALRPFAAIGLVGPSSKFPEAQLTDIVAGLRNEARRIERRHGALIDRISQFKPH